MADDDDDARALVVVLLRRAGYTTFEASDGAQLLETTQSIVVCGGDVVLSDIGMPQCDGVEVARKLRALKPQLPVVLMTSFRDDETVSAARAAGVTVVLTKPLDATQLLAALALAAARSHNG